MNIFYLQLLLGIIFLTIVFLHISKKNIGAVVGYCLQSIIICVILFNSFLQSGEIPLLFITIITFVVKVILSTWFFTNLIKKHALKFSVSSYLSAPITLIILAVLTAIAHSAALLPLTTIVSEHQSLLALALATMFSSLFLIINSKGALAQIIGVLSFENSIVVFAIFAGLEQSASLQVGIIFDILVWLIIATAFVSMIYKHFGSLNVTSMQHLKD